MSAMMTNIDIKIFRLYKKGLSVRSIQKRIGSSQYTQKLIARSIANSELTIEFKEKGSFFIIPSIINYEFRI